jgi:hypothetical protein
MKRRRVLVRQVRQFSFDRVGVPASTELGMWYGTAVVWNSRAKFVHDRPRLLFIAFEEPSILGYHSVVRAC